MYEIVEQTYESALAFKDDVVMAGIEELERSARTMHRMTRAYIPMPTYYIRRSSS
jgi:hypothetical protein